MSSDWIIVGAIFILFAGVILAFRSAAQDTRLRKSDRDTANPAIRDT